MRKLPYGRSTDVVESAVTLCKETAREFPRSTVFTGQLTFRLAKFYHRMLHNETAFSIQRELQQERITAVIMPIQVDLESRLPLTQTVPIEDGMVKA